LCSDGHDRNAQSRSHLADGLQHGANIGILVTVSFSEVRANGINDHVKDPGGLAFRIGQQLLPGDIIGSSIFWDSERVSCTADQILAANENASDRPAQTEAEDFLRDILRDGPRPAKDIESEAKEAGISWRTVNRAKKALGIVVERRAESGDGFGHSGRWYWSLPGGTHSAAKDAKHSYECHDLNVAALGDFGTLRDERAGS
jgi:hypothetical protein